MGQQKPQNQKIHCSLRCRKYCFLQNYGKPGKGPKLEPGMTLAIEPMVIQGKPDILELDDGWTIVTEDCSLSAHYENTILITENEPEILTLL